MTEEYVYGNFTLITSQAKWCCRLKSQTSPFCMPRLWSHEQCPVQGTSPRAMLQNMHTASHASAQLYFCSQSEHDLYKIDHEHRMWHSLWKKFPWDPSNNIWSVWLVYLSIPCGRKKHVLMVEQINTEVPFPISVAVIKTESNRADEDRRDESLLIYAATSKGSC